MNRTDSRSLLYRDPTREHGFEALRVEGKLPVELAGTLYRNGPGLFGSFGRRYYHLFESDGAISAVRFGARPRRGRASRDRERGPARRSARPAARSSAARCRARGASSTT